MPEKKPKNSKIRNLETKSPFCDRTESPVSAIVDQSNTNGRVNSTTPKPKSGPGCKGPGNPGRPSLYTEELAKEICERIAGGETLTKICKEEGKPILNTIYTWLDTIEEFHAAYARARKRQAHTFADELIDIADDTKADPDSHSRKLRVDTRKWGAGVLQPGRYGSKPDTAGPSAPQIFINLPGGQVAVAGHTDDPDEPDDPLLISDD